MHNEKQTCISAGQAQQGPEESLVGGGEVAPQKVSCRRPNKTLAVEEVKRLLNYDPMTGEMRWNEGLHQKRRGVAGFFERGYRKITIDGEGFSVHRLAFVLMTGSWPADEVDHINGNKSDNRWENLREATHKQNLQNLLKARSDSRSGLMGIRKQKDGRWWARIQIDGRRKSLGTHSSMELAHQAYLNAKREMHSFSTI